MRRVDEIALALKHGITPLFLYGMLAEAKRDYEGLMRDVQEADKWVWQDLTRTTAEDRGVGG